MLKGGSYKQYETLMNKMPHLFLEVGPLYIYKEHEQQKQQPRKRN